eukprot:2463519-Amphidinium_carterae.1
MDAGLAVDGSDEPHCKGGGPHKERRPVVQEQVEGERQRIQRCAASTIHEDLQRKVTQKGRTMKGWQTSLRQE